MRRKTKGPAVLSRHEARKIIQVEALLKRLQDNALGILEPPLDQNAIRSAEICLKKALPDLSAVELGGSEENQRPIQITWGKR